MYDGGKIEFAPANNQNMRGNSRRNKMNFSRKKSRTNCRTKNLGRCNDGGVRVGVDDGGGEGEIVGFNLDEVGSGRGPKLIKSIIRSSLGTHKTCLMGEREKKKRRRNSSISSVKFPQTNTSLSQGSEVIEQDDDDKSKNLL